MITGLGTGYSFLAKKGEVFPGKKELTLQKVHSPGGIVSGYLLSDQT